MHEAFDAGRDRVAHARSHFTSGDAQRKQFDAALPQGGRSARPERGDTTGTGARRAKMEQQREAHIAAIRGLLDAQQRTQFDKNVAQMKARLSERGRNGRPEGERRGEGKAS